MATDDLIINPVSLHKLHRTLPARLHEASVAVRALTLGPGNGFPALGGFHDAVETAQRHHRLHEEYVERVRRLMAALELVQSATAAMAEGFFTTEARITAEFRAIADALRPVGKAHDAGRDHA